MAYGAIMGAFQGGWKGALMGAAMGAIGGATFAVGGAIFGSGFGYVALAANAGYTYSTQGWEGVGYMAGGIMGGMIGYKAGNAFNERWQNYQAGDGFRSDRGVRTYKYEREIEMTRALCANNKDTTVTYGTRGLAKNAALDPATTGPKHSYTIKDGSLWEMGADSSTGNIGTTNTIGDSSNWSTSITTQKAITSGLAEQTTVEVNSWGWEEAGMTYEKYWVGQPYMATNHNSNYATATRIYGAGGDVPDNLGWAPKFR